MFNMIIGEYFLRDGLNSAESPKVFHCAPVSPREELPAQFQPTHRLIPVDSDAKMRGLLWLNLQPNTTVAIANKQDYYLFNICQKLSEN